MSSFNKEDYMVDPQGRFVPLDLVKEIDKTRDDLVRDQVAVAKELQTAMIKFKQLVMSEIKAFVDLAAMEWDVKLGGKKGNISLYSYDGSKKIRSEERRVGKEC